MIRIAAGGTIVSSLTLTDKRDINRNLVRFVRKGRTFASMELVTLIIQ